MASRVFQDLSAGEFRDLRSRKISEYFTSSSGGFEHRVDPEMAHLSDALLYESDVLQKFYHDFELLLSNRRGLQGLAKARGFREWWNEHKETYVTRPVVKKFQDANLSLGEFLDDLHLHFLATQQKERDDSVVSFWIKKVSKSKFILAIALFLSLIAEKSGVFLWSLIVLGPGVQMVNSYTQPVITPLAQTASQTGARDLGPVASSIQSWLTQREKQKEVNQKLHEVTNELRQVGFSHLSPTEARARWAKFEDTYFKLFLRYNQALPSHLRDGRGVFRDLMIFAPIGLASNIATFDMQYWVHRRELASVKPGESHLRQMHQREMIAAEDRIAGALAAWKLFQFMYPEIVGRPENRKTKQDLENSYSVFAKSMRFDTYVSQFATQVEAVLKQMDGDFLMQDELLKSKRL